MNEKHLVKMMMDECVFLVGLSCIGASKDLT
jgi:hypothetical protein